MSCAFPTANRPRSMPDVLNMISFQIKVNCSSIALSWRTAGPFICSHPDCGAIYVRLTRHPFHLTLSCNLPHASTMKRGVYSD